MARLVVNPGSPAAWEIRLKAGRNALGRRSENDFPIEDPSVSGSHCTILIENGQTIIADLGSTNGTFVDNAPVRQAALTDGQAVRLGTVPMLFLSDSPVDCCTASAPDRPDAAHVIVNAPIGSQRHNPRNCKHHPRTPARFGCPQCGHFFCDLCVSSHHSGPVVHKSCRHCGVNCFPVQVQVHPAAEKTFYQRLPSAFAYPFRGAGVVIVVVGMVLVALLKLGAVMMQLGSLRFLVFGIILQVLAGGYLFSFLQNIVHSTTAGDKELPDLPGFSNAWDDILLPFLRLLGLILFCFGPAIMVGIWVGATGWSGGGSVLFGAILFGAVYFPMAFLAVAVLDSAVSANPLVVVPSIFKVPGEYLVTLLTLGAVFGFRALGDVLLPLVFPEGFSTVSMPLLFAYIGSNALWGFLSLYLLLVATHLLGLLYVCRSKTLGWLERSN